MTLPWAGPEKWRYRALIGVGGIGTGTFFALNGNHTLGREESRSGRFLDQRDYAKLHIITHYVQKLMGAAFKVLPIGRVGNDESGRCLMQEMATAGIPLKHVTALEGIQTMNCICLVYPDGSGGNLTVDESACSKVDVAAVREAEADFAAFAGQGIALAVPEVPMAARAELLSLAARHAFMRAASFTSEEIREAQDNGLLDKTDLLVINVDEAATLASVPEDGDPERVAESAMRVTCARWPALRTIITAGSAGSWVWDGNTLSHAPAYPAQAVNTAGAGDAFFAGVLVGLATGLALGRAQQLGSLLGALSVTSPHTINDAIGQESLLDF